MSPERREHHQPYPFTEHERSFDRITTNRLLELINDPATQVHSLELTGNTYGEFLFVSTSRPSGESRAGITFWGAGYHEYRERWLTQEWFWYQSFPRPDTAASQLDKEAVHDTILARLAEISAYGEEDKQSARGKLFDLMADLSDDDGAIIDIEDMADWFLDDNWDRKE